MHEDEIGVVAGVEAVHVLDEKMIPILDVDVQYRLLVKGVLCELETVESTAGYGRYVVSILGVVGKGRADVEDVGVVPGLIALGAHEREGRRALVVGGHPEGEIFGLQRDIGHLVFFAGALKERAAYDEVPRLEIGHQEFVHVVGQRGLDVARRAPGRMALGIIVFRT